MLLDCEFLNAVVISVDDVQVAVAVQGDAVRRIELAGLGPLLAEAAQILALRRELLDAAADGTYPDPVVPIDADADRAFFNAALLAAEDAAEAARLVLVVAPGQQKPSVRRKLPDSPHGRLGRVDVALAVER